MNDAHVPTFAHREQEAFVGHDLSTDGGWTAALDALVGELEETQRALAMLESRQAQLLSDAVDLALARASLRGEAHRTGSRSDLAIREVAAELGAAMRVTDRTAQARMGDAATLTMRFPDTFDAWCDGRIDGTHVRVILDAGSVIGDDDVRRRYEQLVLPVAACETSARLRAMARSVAAQVDPDASKERQRRATASRRVQVIDGDDGMARLIADLPAPLAYAIRDRLDEMARVVRDDEAHAPDAGVDEARRSTGSVARGEARPARPDRHGGPAVVTGPGDGRADAPGCGERSSPTSSGVDAEAPTRARTPGEPIAPAGRTRTMDQIRADVLADLLLAGSPAAHGDGDALSAVRGRIQVTIPVLTEIGAGDEPSLLAGYGPVDLDVARMLAGRAGGWDRVLTHPMTGVVLAVDRYRPDEALRRHLIARDEHCRAPGCRRPAVRSDLDHTVDAALGGPTDASNLAHLCRRHHVLKHQTAWRVVQKARGVLEWYSPTGRRYEDRPPSTVRFVPTDGTAAVAHSPDAGSPPPF